MVARLSSDASNHASYLEHLCALRAYTASDYVSLEVERSGDHLDFIKHACSVVIGAVLMEEDIQSGLQVSSYNP